MLEPHSWPAFVIFPVHPLEFLLLLPHSLVPKPLPGSDLVSVAYWLNLHIQDAKLHLPLATVYVLPPGPPQGTHGHLLSQTFCSILLSLFTL